MYYGLKNPNRKQEFINQINQQIKVYEHLIQGLETCVPFIQSFNGKVLNVKLTNAISKAENPNRLSYSITQKAGYSGMAISITDSYNRMYPSVDKNTMNYLTSYKCVFHLPTTKPDEWAQDRINADEAVKQIEIEKDYLLILIKECSADLQMYDEEITAWEELEKQIEVYEKKFSPRLRGTITMSIR